MKLNLLVVALLTLIPSISRAEQGNGAIISYYYGAVVYLGPDGKTQYGQSVSLVKRTVDQASKTITELVTQPDRKNPKAYNDFMTTMTLDSGTTFKARDEGNTFSGSLTFSGPNWQWNHWIYGLNLTAGGKIVGAGTLDQNGITTHKQVLGPDGKISVLVNESLPPISEEQYNTYHKVMSPTTQP